MNVRRTLAVTANLFRRLRHDPRTVGMIVMMPIIFIVLFGFTFAGEPNHVPTIVVNLDRGIAIETGDNPPISALVGHLNRTEGETFSLSDGVVERLSTNDTLEMTESADLAWARDRLDRGQVVAVLYIPPDYTAGRLLDLAQSIGDGMMLPQVKMLLGIDDGANLSKDVVFYVDRANTQVYAAVVQSVNGAFLGELRASTPLGEITTFMDVVSVYGENAEFVDFFAPGIMVIAATMITIILTIISFVRERNMGILARLFASPMSAAELVAGYSIGFGLISTCQSLELLGIGIALFQIQIVGSIFLALGLIIALAIGVLGLGILLSTIAKNEFQAIQFVPLVLIPAIVLSGVFWPVEAMPPFFKPVSAGIPMTYAVDGLRSVMVRGWTLEQVWPQFLFLICFALATLALAVIVMQRKSRNC